MSMTANLIPHSIDSVSSTSRPGLLPLRISIWTAINDVPAYLVDSGDGGGSNDCHVEVPTHSMRSKFHEVILETAAQLANGYHKGSRKKRPNCMDKRTQKAKGSSTCTMQEHPCAHAAVEERTDCQSRLKSTKQTPIVQARNEAEITMLAETYGREELFTSLGLNIHILPKDHPSMGATSNQPEEMLGSNLEQAFEDDETTMMNDESMSEDDDDWLDYALSIEDSTDTSKTLPHQCEPDSSATNIHLQRDIYFKPVLSPEQIGPCQEVAPMKPFLRRRASQNQWDRDTAAIPLLTPATRISTCFRVAELLRILNDPSEPMPFAIELYAMAREHSSDISHNATHVLLADIFFPERPPYILGIREDRHLQCLRQLHPDTPGSTRTLIRAIVQFVPRHSQENLKHSTPSQCHTVSSPGIRAHVGLLSIRRSDWNEVKYVRGIVDPG